MNEAKEVPFCVHNRGSKNDFPGEKVKIEEHVWKLLKKSHYSTIFKPCVEGYMYPMQMGQVFAVRWTDHPHILLKNN